MKRGSAYLLLLPGAILILANWSVDQTTVTINGMKKNKLNFYGMLHTRNGEVYSVDNISIGRQYEQIRVYEKPSSDATTLTEDPKKSIKTKIDLCEIKEIRTVHPLKTWTYQKREGSAEERYIEIEVIYKGKSEPDIYLIDTRRELMCDRELPSGPEEKDVPFERLDHITIDGCKERKEPSEAEQKKTCDCAHSKTAQVAKGTSSRKKSRNLLAQARPDAPLEPPCPEEPDCKPCGGGKVTQ